MPGGFSTQSSVVKAGLIKIVSNCSGCYWHEVSYATSSPGEKNAMQEHFRRFQSHSCTLNNQPLNEVN